MRKRTAPRIRKRQLRSPRQQESGLIARENNPRDQGGARVPLTITLIERPALQQRAPAEAATNPKENLSGGGRSVRGSAAASAGYAASRKQRFDGDPIHCPSTASILTKLAIRSASVVVRSNGIFDNVTTKPGRTGTEDWYASGPIEGAGSVACPGEPGVPWEFEAFSFLLTVEVALVLTVKLAGSSLQFRNKSIALCTRRPYSFREDGLKSFARLLLNRFTTAAMSCAARLVRSCSLSTPNTFRDATAKAVAVAVGISPRSPA